MVAEDAADDSSKTAIQTSSETNANPEQISVANTDKVNKRRLENDLSIPAKRNKTIHTLFDNIKSYEEGGDKHAIITNSLTYMIAVDNNPLSMTERPGFKKFMRVVCPRYKLPSRRNVTRLLEGKYHSLREKVKSDLSKLKFLSLTTDCWTEKHTTKSYIGLTAHYPDPDSYLIVSINLGCFPLNERHTAANLQKELENITSQWCINKEMISAIVTDYGANMVKACHDFVGKSYHLRCFAHNVQLLPEDAMKQSEALKEIVDKDKKIVTFFKTSNNAADELRRLQQIDKSTDVHQQQDQQVTPNRSTELDNWEESDEETPVSGSRPLKLLQSCATRWNSTFYMIERFLKLQSVVLRALFNLRSPLATSISPNDLDTLKDVIELFRPIEQVTKELSAEKHVTCSKILPFIDCLKEAINDARPDSTVGIFLQLQLSSAIQDRFRNYSKDFPMLPKATLVDPRFKKLYFTDPMKVVHLMKDITIEMKVPDFTGVSDVNIENGVNLENKGSDIWRHHQRKTQAQANSSCEENEASNISPELRNYLSQKVIPRSEDPLKWWEGAKNTFPNVYLVARKYLSIPATSVPSERLFSRAGLIDSERRSSLDPECLSQLVFLSGMEEKEWGLG